MTFSKAIVAALLMFTFTACGGNAYTIVDTTSAREDASSSIQKLEAADEIFLDKDAFTIADHWTVKVDGEQVADVAGITLKFGGEVYSLISPKGGFMAGEDESIFTIAKEASFYDQDQNVTGELRKEIISLLGKYELRDNDGNIVAKLDQKFAWGFKGEVKDANGNVAWKFSRKVVSIGASIVMERSSESTVSALDAIRMILVANEVYEAESS